MITKQQIEMVDKAVELGFRSQDSSNAWNQINISIIYNEKD